MDFLYLFGNCFCVHVPVVPLVMVAGFFVFVGFCVGIAAISVYEVAICIFDYIPL